METILTIVIPCFNHGAYLEETLKSVYNSTKQYIPEIIILNDGSTDELTLEVLKKVEKSGVLVIHQENQGLSKTRNNGIQIAKGKYILPLDSDNNVCFDYLNTAVELLEKRPDIDIIYGNAKYIGERSGTWKNHQLDTRKMLYSNHIDACAIFRKQTWESVNGYPIDMQFVGCEDWIFWLKCIQQKSQFYFLDKICFEYRVLSNSMSRNFKDDIPKKVMI